MNLRAALLFSVLLVPALMTSTAGAVELSVIGPTSATIAPGGSFTINIGLDNASATSNNGVTSTISGLAAAGAVVTSGVSADKHFADFCSATQCFGGIDSNPTAFFDPTDLSMSGAYTPGDDSVVIISALAFTEGTGTGALDPGLAGVFGSHDPNDVQITLTANTVGTHVLDITGFFSQSGSQAIPTTATFTITVPEPGAIASSLAGLASVFAVVGIRRRF